MVVFDQGLEDERLAALKAKKAERHSPVSVLRRWEASHAVLRYPIVNGSGKDEDGKPYAAEKTECMCELCADTRAVLHEQTDEDKAVVKIEKKEDAEHAKAVRDAEPKTNAAKLPPVGSRQSTPESKPKAAVAPKPKVAAPAPKPHTPAPQWNPPWATQTQSNTPTGNVPTWNVPSGNAPLHEGYQPGGYRP